MLFGWLGKLVCACTSKNADANEDINEDPLVWWRDLAPHCLGDFSMAVVQANDVIEDCCQVEAGGRATFVGVYDGHAGTDASLYIRDHLFQNLIGHIPEDHMLSQQVLRSAVLATEEGFTTTVRRGYLIKPELGKVGSCCLAGVMYRGALYVANLGDSRAVIGTLNRFGRIRAEQLTRDHNANNPNVRLELLTAHPNDPQIVFQNHGSWRVKGIIQVSRAIGDAYLKRHPFTLAESFPKFEEVPPPFTQAVISAEPEMHSREIRNSDRFIIFASDGLWELLTNQQAVDIVHKNPRNGIAKRVLKAALTESAKRRNIKYRDLQKVAKGHDTRRSYHDDISVIVVFLDHVWIGGGVGVQELSYIGGSDGVAPSNFRNVQLV